MSRAATQIAEDESTTISEVEVEDEDKVDLSLLRELGKNGLINALNSVNGAKTLVLDPTVAGPLGLLTEVSLLKQHGVDKMFWLESGPLVATTTNIVYLTRGKISWIKIIADQIKRHVRDGAKHLYTILLVPRTSALVTRVLEEEGVLGEVTISSFNMQLIPLEDDLISLEHDNAFKEIWVDGDETAVYDSAQALITFQKLFGLFPRIIGKGDSAGRLTGLLQRQVKELEGGSKSDKLLTRSDKIDSLIILDRRVDMITPMLTQLTYEGLIDETLGIKNSYVELPASLLTPAKDAAAPPSLATSSASVLSKETKKKHHLTAANDVLFLELRDLNFSAVGMRLNKTARRLEEDYKGNLKAKTVAQLRDFVGKLGGLQSQQQSLRIHIGVTEMITPSTRTEVFNKSLEIQQNLLSNYDTSAQIAAIEDLVAQGASMQLVLRLLCLASIVTGGIKTKTLESLKREILQSYGYEYLPVILALSSPPLGLLLPNPLPPSAASLASTKIPYSNLRKVLRLVNEDPDDFDDPADISYVYSGYAPMSVRLVQCVAQKGAILKVGEGGDAARKGKGVAGGKARAHPIVGWKGFEDVLESIPGETIDVLQAGPAGTEASIVQTVANSLLSAEKTATTVVFFLGGCTYTEIAALRWVGRQNKGRRILIATTGIVSGASIMNSLAGAVVSGAPSKDASTQA